MKYFMKLKARSSESREITHSSSPINISDATDKNQGEGKKLLKRRKRETPKRNGNKSVSFIYGNERAETTREKVDKDTRATRSEKKTINESRK